MSYCVEANISQISNSLVELVSIFRRLEKNQLHENYNSNNESKDSLDVKMDISSQYADDIQWLIHNLQSMPIECFTKLNGTPETLDGYNNRIERVFKWINEVYNVTH
ncbi:MAG: hypothetical protein HUJ68_09760 [Clostridia bacterium]|nr:hypothetical protein [Clostridia bacterium]